MTGTGGRGRANLHQMQARRPQPNSAGIFAKFKGGIYRSENRRKAER